MANKLLDLQDAVNMQLAPKNSSLYVSRDRSNNTI